MTEQTRFKYGLIFCALVLVEGIIKHYLAGFPFDMAVAVQAGAVGVYTISKSAVSAVAIKAEAGPK